MGDPRVMVSTGEVVQRTRVLALHEEDSLKQALSSHQVVLAATDKGYAMGNEGAAPVVPSDLRVNRQRLNEQAKQIKKTLDECQAHPIPEKERDRYAKRCKDLEAIFVDWLETRRELSVRKRSDPDWQSAMKKARQRTQVDPKIEAAISEWQSIKRRLDPGNPDAGNLHDLRKDR
jgi:hypothetical protein